MIDIVKKFDDLQYRHKPLSFVVAVVKRYSNDQAGKQAALITYYLFMSLFPLLLWLSLLSNWVNRLYPGVANGLIHGATNYFPVLGQELFKIAHSAHRSLSGMIVAGLVALYGARGTAMAFMTIVNDAWQVPKDQRKGFPYSWIRGIGIVVFGGGGFVLTAAASSWALVQTHGNTLKVFVALLSIVLLTLVFMAILRLSLPKTTHVRRLFGGALTMAIALSVLQIAGGFIVTHDLKHYTNAYTALFATTLGLLAWIFLEAQILLYSIEITVVVDKKLWPVRLAGGQ